MKKIIILLLVLSAFASNLACAEARSNITFGKWIHAQMKTYNIPGASIAIIKNYHVIFAKGYGYANKKEKTPILTTTLFQAASISKPITAAATLITFHRKHLSLNANINGFLHTWKLPPSPFTKNTPVTMKLLLSHSAGITGFRFKGYPQGEKLPTINDILLGKKPANTPPIVVVREPGSKYEYSPAGYTIIQKVLMDIYKEPFSKIMHSLILQPLHMFQSTFATVLSKQQRKKIATAYLPNSKPILNGPYRFPASAAGGLWTTPAQLAHFLIAFEKANNGIGRGILQPSLVHKMLKPSPKNHNMGLGIDINLNKFANEVSGHGNYFGFSGFNTGYLSLMVGSKYGNGVIIMVNTAPYMTVKNIKQFQFLKNVEKYIALQERWKK